MKLLLSVLTLLWSCHAQDVLVSLPITVDGATKNLELHRGESIEKAALSFMETNGLIENGIESERSQQVIQQLAGMLRERAPKDVHITLPLTVDGSVSDLILYKNEEPHDAVARFLRESSLSEELKTQAHPQILSMLQQRLQEEATPPKQEPMFTIDLTIDGQAATVEHYEGQDPLIEAREFARRLEITNEEFLQRLLPQVANMIQTRLEGMAAPKEMFSIPLTVNGQSVVLVHYENSSPTQSAMNFLTQQGLTDAATVDAYLPQLVEMIDREIAQRTAPTTREPLFSLPITIGSMTEQMNYYEGDSPDVTAQLFMEANGLTNDPNYASLVQQLANLIRQNINDIVQARTAAANADAQPLFKVPVNLGGTDFEIPYFANQDPAVVATNFCDTQMAAISANMGRQVIPEELQQCKVFLFQTITGILDKAQTPQEETQAQPKEPELLFTLDIDLGDGKNAALPYYQGDNEEAVARAFCQKYNVDVENVPFLVEEIRRQIANL